MAAGKETIDEEIESLTIHGVSKIVSSRTKIARSTWTFLCIVAFSILIYCTTNSISRHLRKEVFTSVKRAQKNHMTLPAITFCNTNVGNFFPKFNGTFPVDQELPDNCSCTGKKYFKNEINRQYFLQACHWFSAFKPTNTSANVPKVGQYKLTLTPFPKHFSFLPSFWPCFTLNRDKTLTQYSAGDRAGLRMILFFNESEREYFPFPDVLDDERRGLFVAIHDPKEFISDFTGIFLPTGFHTSIEVSKHTVKRKPSPFPSKCVHSGQESNENIFPGKQNVKNCLYSCFSLTVYRLCGGAQMVMQAFMKPDKYPNILNFSNATAMKCAQEAVNHMNDCDCPLPCEEEVYQTKVNRLPWPMQWQRELLRGQLNTHAAGSDASIGEHFTRNHLLKLNIYYSDLIEFTYTEEESYGKMSIVSDFGGQMGLFIGASVISFVELIILLFHCIKSWNDKRKNVESCNE